MSEVTVAGSPDSTHGVSLRPAVVTALFCTLASGLLTAARLEPLPIVSLFFSVGPLIVVILWLQADAHRTRVGAVHDLGLFLWFAWAVVIPWYAWKTRGRAGWRLALGLFALICSGYAGQFLGML